MNPQNCQEFFLQEEGKLMSTVAQPEKDIKLQTATLVSGWHTKLKGQDG
jgi:hypothetical protein